MPRGRTRSSLRTRLGVIAFAGLTSTAVMAGVAVQSTLQLNSALDDFDRIQSADTLVLRLHELDDALHGAVLHHAYALPGTAENLTASMADLDALNSTVLALATTRLPGIADSTTRELALEQSIYASNLRIMLVRTVTRPQMDTFEARTTELLDRVRGFQTELDHLRIIEKAQVTELIWQILRRIGAAFALAAISLTAITYWHRRRLIAAIGTLAGVAESVTRGELSARTGIVDGGELGELSGALDAMAENLADAFGRLTAQAERQEFSAQLDRALERVDAEEELPQVLGDVLRTAGPALDCEVLIADSSEAHLRRFAWYPDPAPAGCQVRAPWSCPAVRGGRTLTHTDGGALDACPQLKCRADVVAAAVCVPISFMGRAMGVLHCVGEVTPSAAVLERLKVVSARTATRLGTLRALARAERQAATDPLTGLLNRRSFDERARRMIDNHAPFGLMMADLDHFKQLNDVYGHDMGDRALRGAADLMQRTTRPEDLVCRYGGEEFVLLCAGLSMDATLDVAERIRVELEASTKNPGMPPVTVSIGVTHSSVSPTLAGLLKIADQALLEAKGAGRNRCLSSWGAATEWSL